MGEQRIEDDADYRATAREFSHKLRHQIKESYFSFHNTLKVTYTCMDFMWESKLPGHCTYFWPQDVNQNGHPDGDGEEALAE